MSSEGGERSRWRRALAWALLLGATYAAVVARRRPDPQERKEAIRQFNRRRLNPLMLRAAGRRHWYAARLEHVGRRSGRPYTTPIVARPVAGGFAVPLPYGRGVDWLRNLEAAGSGTLVVGGRRYTVTGPRVVPGAEVADQLTAIYRLMARRDPAAPWLLVRAVPAVEPSPPARAEPASSGRNTGPVVCCSPPPGSQSTTPPPG